MYMVFDLETETHSPYKRKANPFCEHNWVVMRGWKKQGDSCAHAVYYPVHNRTSYLAIPDDITYLVGFNLKFDLLWEMAQGNPDLLAFFKRGGKIWCCQYGEYLLEGQTEASQMCALDDVVDKYGGRKKIDEVKILWQAGVKTSEIQEDLLTDYLIGTEEEGRNSGDIGNTELTFLGQLKRAKAQGQLKMIQDRMDGLLCTTEMEYRGLKVDVAEAASRLQVLLTDLNQRERDLEQYIPKDLPFTFNWASGTHVSCLLFGGTVKYEARAHYIDDKTGELARLKAYEQWPLVCGVPYKSVPDGSEQDVVLSGANKGAPKFRKVEVQGPLKSRLTDFLFPMQGYTTPEEEWELKTTDGAGKPIYSTSEDTMIELGQRDIPFLKGLRAKQKLDKEIGTYYVKTNSKGEKSGMLTCVQKHDHFMHHKLNHTNTVTTRLSSNDPNMQNIPTNAVVDGQQKSQVKKMFVSRFNAAYCLTHNLPPVEAGVMGEIDYSQLEVVVQGVLTKDENLCQDLRNRIDFHCKRVSAKFGCTYEEALKWCKDETFADFATWKARRTGVKEFSFQRAYGAGAAAIADKTGLPIDDIKAMIEAEELLYPGVIAFNLKVEKEVNDSCVPFQTVDHTTGAWKTYRRGYYVGPTGTRYSFRSWNAPAFMAKRGVSDTFSPPEMKNYPVQGTGGEFVQAMLGLLWRHFVKMDFYGGMAYLVNTVHDCVWVDMHPSVVDQVMRDMKRIMSSIPEFYNSRHGMDINVPFPVDAEVGPNMNDLHHWVDNTLPT